MVTEGKKAGHGQMSQVNWGRFEGELKNHPKWE